jgi:opacity protein-like surface antigen
MRVALTALFVLAPQVAWAGEDGLRGFLSGGFYARADASYGLESDQDSNFEYTINFNDPALDDEALFGSGGWELPEGFGFSVGAGWAAQNSGLRLEGLLIHERRDESIPGLDGYEAELRSTGLYGVAYYDFNPYGLAQPYLGLGAGMNSVELDLDLIEEETDARMSFLATLGMGFVLGDHLVGDVAYRFQHTPDLEHSWAYTDSDPVDGYTERLRVHSDLSQHAVTFGLRYMVRPPRSR